ncbi:Ubiquitinyl hydrolase 1, partial [Scytalidium lignicola]
MEVLESLEELHTRHRKEQRDLQSRITQKKKGATKKTRKGVNSECEELERQLAERQGRELAALNGELPVPDIDNVPELDGDSSNEGSLPALTSETTAQTNGMKETTEALEKMALSTPSPSEEGQPRKRNRQKERLARRAAEQEAVAAEAEKEAANQPDPKAVERNVMLKEFQARGLTEKLIAPNGHCLFSAVADQLSRAGIPIGAESDAELQETERYKPVRRAAARYMEAHPDDFAAWLEEPLQDHIYKIRDTAEWGGHLELLALAKSYNVEICVLQNGSSQTIEPGTDGKSPLEKIWLAYYRHGFGLGEHYNSVFKAS